LRSTLTYSAIILKNGPPSVQWHHSWQRQNKGNPMRVLLKFLVYAVLLAMVFVIIQLAIIVFVDDSCPTNTTEENESCVLPE